MLPLIAAMVVLTLAAVLFLARPLARGSQVDTRERLFQMQGVRERLLAQLNELDIEDRDHNMDAGVASDERARLEGELAQVLKDLEEVAPAAPKSADHVRLKAHWRWTVATLAVAVPAITFGFYGLNASVPISQLEQAGAAPFNNGMPNPMEMVARLEQRLQQNPNDPQGWLRLGRSYVVLKRLEEAKTAYQHAYKLLPKDYQPESPDAYWFIGLAAYEAGDVKRALALWEVLLKELPPETESAQQLKQVIEKAKQQGRKKK